MAEGLVSTQDSYIDGPIAYVGMNGNLDMVKELISFRFKRFQPHITASLPVVATIAGGPVVGVAAWVASKIINHGMQSISGYAYKISGPWARSLLCSISGDALFCKEK